MRYLYIILILTGCASVVFDGPDAQGYHWVNNGPVGNPVIYKDVDVFLYCGLEEKAKSCAIQRGDGICSVYLPPDPEPWQEGHELRHCQGWRHP